MADVGVRELKQRLSEYPRSRRARRAAPRDRAWASQGSARSAPGPRAGRDGHHRGLDHGRLRRGLPPVRRVKAGGRVLDALAQVAASEHLRGLERSAQALCGRTGLGRGRVPSAERPVTADGSAHGRRSPPQSPRLLDGRKLAAARSAFAADLEVLSIIELDAVTCEGAAAVAEVTGVRTLDALHLSAAQRVGGRAVPFLTFDRRQAQAARALGLTVVGA
jgi:PIN domain